MVNGDGAVRFRLTDLSFENGSIAVGSGESGVAPTRWRERGRRAHVVVRKSRAREAVAQNVNGVAQMTHLLA